MKKTFKLLATALMATAFAAPALAQDGTITLQVTRGTVMASDGGEFTTASTGKLLAEGQRIMVTEGSGARVVYSDSCVIEYNTPGVYVVDEQCKRAVAVLPVDYKSLGIVLGTTAVAAAILGNMDEVPPTGVSR